MVIKQINKYKVRGQLASIINKYKIEADNPSRALFLVQLDMERRFPLIAQSQNIVRKFEIIE